MDHSRAVRFLEEDLPRIKSDLPFSPALLAKLFSQVKDGTLAPLDDIAGTIAQDQALSTKVLALSNSAFYGLQAQVGGIPRAVAVLGLKEIRNLVLAVGAQRMCKKKPPEFDLPGYWKHQLITATAARQLAKLMDHPDPDALFACGLLHDLGKLLVASNSPDDWRAIEVIARERRLPYVKAEQEHWGLEHGLVGALTLNSWNLPDDITEPVNWHHSPDAAPAYGREAAILRLADALAHAEEATPGAVAPAPAFFEALAIDEQETRDALAQTLRTDGLAHFASILA